MLKKITFFCPPATSEGVLVKKAADENRRHVREMQKAAERRIQTLRQEATEHARMAIRSGYIEGFQTGFSAIVPAALHFLQDCDDYLLQQRRKIEQDIRETLSGALDQPEVVLSLISEWASHSSLTDTHIQLCIPESARAYVEDLMQTLQDSLGLHAEIIFHQDNRYLLSCGDHIAEFCPDTVTDGMTQTLMDQYGLVQEELNKISRTALNLLIRHCQSVTDNRTASQEKEENR